MSFRNDFLNTTNSRGIPGRFARRTQLLNADLARASQSSNASSPDSGNAQSMDHSPLPLNNTFEKDATATADIGAA
ncbi:hypothetical protein SJAG_00715 [Schizosaccharomyces japonicus yFS275]|uniref:Uncharacterized protein n=1 Tax=Schizosaccharomyces japonicus (strain yFS275 / FY16936) TaxID=402676 RepID=B6JWE0_SCHJY|nr:hypothetical protein SJAG_00715 [Schizosaccharomyces japonicus yFS275]EEB05691.1 hypothetical protein SJAG_00715 [Schizosaccharomyces japonicus yFS275]